MKKPKPLPFLQAYRDRHGRVRTYYRRNGIRQAIEGVVGTAAWLENYQRIHKSFERAPKGGPPPGTLAEAVLAYLESPRFKKLRPRTQSNYRRELDKVVEHMGKAKLANITRGVIVQLRDKVALTSPRRGLELLKVLRLVFAAAMDADLVDRDPTRGVSGPVGYKAEPWRPWSTAEIEVFLAGAAPVWRRAMMVLLFTGLRRGDAVELKRSDIRNDRIYYRTSKTGAKVVIPIHPALASELERPLPVEGLTLSVGTRGRPIRGDVLSHSIAKEARRLGIENPPPTHGLRKNAVAALVEAGLTVEEIHAITGQSAAMIRHYAQDFERDRLVDRAVVKLSFDRD
jgi:integrase